MRSGDVEGLLFNYPQKNLFEIQKIGIINIRISYYKHFFILLRYWNFDANFGPQNPLMGMKKLNIHLGLKLKYLIPAIASSDQSLSNIENQEICLMPGETLLDKHRLQEVQYWLQAVELGHLPLVFQLHFHGGVLSCSVLTWFHWVIPTNRHTQLTQPRTSITDSRNS